MGLPCLALSLNLMVQAGLNKFLEHILKLNKWWMEYVKKYPCSAKGVSTKPQIAPELNLK